MAGDQAHFGGQRINVEALGNSPVLFNLVFLLAMMTLFLCVNL